MTSIGVDVGKAQYDACAYGVERSEHFEGSDGLKRLLRFIERHAEPHVVLEASGHYERPVCEALQERGIAFTVVNPARARAFMTSVGRLAKTDAIDARLLARMGHTLSLEPTVLPSPERRELQALVLRRQQLTEQLVMQRSQCEHVRSAKVRSSIERVSKLLKTEVLCIERAIRELIASTAELSASSARLQTVPGVGPTVAAGLLVYLPELGKLDRGQAAALAGLAPYNADSGAHQGKRKIRAGRSPLRALLYMAALVASRRNPALRPIYLRLCQRGKPKKLALIAIARKLVVALNSMLKHGTDWRAGSAEIAT